MACLGDPWLVSFPANLFSESEASLTISFVSSMKLDFSNHCAFPRFDALRSFNTPWDDAVTVYTTVEGHDIAFTTGLCTSAWFQ